MKKELVIYRNLLTAYKAVKDTYKNDGVPNQSVWRMAKRVILNAHAELGYELVSELQERAIIKSGIKSAEPFDYTAFDLDNPDNWAKSE